MRRIKSGKRFEQSHLCTEYCNRCSEKPPCCQINTAFWTNDGSSFQNEFIVEQNICDKNHFQDFVTVSIVRYVCQKEQSNFQYEKSNVQNNNCVDPSEIDLHH